MRSFKAFHRFMALSALIVCYTALPALAEDITWPGNGVLQNDPLYNSPDCLFPNSLSGNSVTVNDDVSGTVFGGVAANGSTDDVMNNRVFFNSGVIGNSIYGGATDKGDAHDNAVYIKGGEATSVSGGFAKTSGDAYGNTIEMTGGRFRFYTEATPTSEMRLTTILFYEMELLSYMSLAAKQ